MTNREKFWEEQQRIREEILAKFILETEEKLIETNPVYAASYYITLQRKLSSK